MEGTKKLVYRDPECKEVGVFVPNFKFLEGGLSHVIKISCTCSVEKKWCVLHNPNLEVPSFPIEKSLIKSLKRKLLATGHSFRRTAALFFRIRYQEDLSEFLSLKDFEMRINQVFKWAPKSAMLRNYSVDWEKYRKTTFAAEAAMESVFRMIAESAKRDIVKEKNRMVKVFKALYDEDELEAREPDMSDIFSMKDILSEAVE